MQNTIKLSNKNYGKKNEKPKISISGYLNVDNKGFGPSVYIHISTGFLNGGFHTSIDDAKALKKLLEKAIKQAENNIKEK